MAETTKLDPCPWCGATARQQSDGWTTIDERLPKTGQWVMVVIAGIVQRLACELDENHELGDMNPRRKVWNWADSDADSAPFCEVTHWCPLPEPPGKEGR